MKALGRHVSTELRVEELVDRNGTYAGASEEITKLDGEEGVGGRETAADASRR
jgi:hypothetical protein